MALNSLDMLKKDTLSTSLNFSSVQCTEENLYFINETGIYFIHSCTNTMYSLLSNIDPRFQ